MLNTSPPMLMGSDGASGALLGPGERIITVTVRASTAVAAAIASPAANPRLPPSSGRAAERARALTDLIAELADIGRGPPNHTAEYGDSPAACHGGEIASPICRRRAKVIE
jgi:hypothetical protein